jgi:hypothetical protein
VRSHATSIRLTRSIWEGLLSAPSTGRGARSHGHISFTALVNFVPEYPHKRWIGMVNDRYEDEARVRFIKEIVLTHLATMHQFEKECRTISYVALAVCASDRSHQASQQDRNAETTPKRRCPTCSFVCSPERFPDRPKGIGHRRISFHPRSTSVQHDSRDARRVKPHTARA